MRHHAGISNFGRTVVLLAAVLAATLAVTGVAAAPLASAAAAKGTSSKGTSSKGSNASTTKPMRPESTSGIAGWRLVGHYTENTVYAGEGVATVTSGGKSKEIYRGIGTVPTSLKAEGWTHVGDPDADDGYIVDAYQGSSTGDTKMFLVTTPSGQTYQYIHTLVAGELYNNSFDAISPGGQWMVAGTWTTMKTLQIYPTPLLNHRTPRHGGALSLAGSIKLDHDVYYVQGCDFVTSTELICSSTGNSSLFTNPKPLLEIDLSSALHGHSVKGRVLDLGSIPEHSSCAATGTGTGTFESEGVDYDTATGILRVEMIEPGSCILKTTVYEYKQTKAGKAASRG